MSVGYRVMREGFNVQNCASENVIRNRCANIFRSLGPILRLVRNAFG